MPQTSNTLEAIIYQIIELNDLSWHSIKKVLNKNAKPANGFFSKEELLNTYKKLLLSKDIKISAQKEQKLLQALKTKPTRTHSGVVTLTLLTKPFPCPGECIFCPNDVRMPKSYISSEPGAQRAERNYFDPYLQSYRRLQALQSIGHSVDKIEVIILGGTWSFYPEKYQIWFIKRIFEAVNDLCEGSDQLETTQNIAKTLEIEKEITIQTLSKISDGVLPQISTTYLDASKNTLNQAKILGFDKTEVEGVKSENSQTENAKLINQKTSTTYNQIVSKIVARNEAKKPLNWESATWEDLFYEHKKNETSKFRVVGLVVETRPDHISAKELIRVRRLGATKVQIGFQSLDDEVLLLNKRGHTVRATRKAVNLIRQFGFKIHAHWMANLYGSNPKKDITDYKKIFSDSDFRPDELKIYPCSLVETSELVEYYKSGLWRPYSDKELFEILVKVIPITPEYCRLTRIIRDIPGTEILVGSKITNLRQLVEEYLFKNEIKVRDIRSREIKNTEILESDLKLKIINYKSSTGKEKFLQFVNQDGLIAGFLRLSLPDAKKHPHLEELDDCAMIREVHVYGTVVDLGDKTSGKAQHLGLGTKLIDKAKKLVKDAGYSKLAVISSIGTRKYYEKRGFELKELYQICDFEKKDEAN